MTTSNPFYAFPEPARARFVAFDAHFLKAAQSMPIDWLATPGLMYSKNVPYGESHARFYFPASAPKFEKLKDRNGEPQFRDLFSKYFDQEWEKWQDGVAANKEMLSAPGDFSGWAQQPTAFARARDRAHLAEAARVIEANGVGWDENDFFAVDHNVSMIDASAGTQANLVGSRPFSATNLDLGITDFRKLRGMEGDRIGWTPDTIIYPTDLASAVEELVDPSWNPGPGTTVTNKFRGKMRLLEIPQLTDTTSWYLANLSYPEYTPLLRLRGNGGNLERIAHGDESELAKRDDKYALDYRDRFSFRLGLHHAIMRFQSGALS
jgi:hypothetical protein